jgi:CRISPR/Cas system CMR-associated protein Cmr5 small subunit
MKQPKQKPVYTRARHEIYQPKFVQKKIQIHKKFVFEQHDSRETFFSAYASVVQFIPGSDTNGHVPCAFLNLTLGNYNRFQIHTRDVVAMANSINELSTWLMEHADQLQNVLNGELDKHSTYNMKMYFQTNENNEDQPTLP